MNKNRLEAFSDGFLAIVITIMVLELRPPSGSDFADLLVEAPIFGAYLLSFIYIGIYWNNHHHMLKAARRVDGAVLWANLHLLFWLSLVPFATQWLGRSTFALAPCVVYGLDLLLCALAYYGLQLALIRADGQGSVLRGAIGSDVKGKLSPIIYVLAIGLAFVAREISIGLYVLVAIIWLAPDRRIERVLNDEGESDRQEA